MSSTRMAATRAGASSVLIHSSVVRDASCDTARPAANTAGTTGSAAANAATAIACAATRVTLFISPPLLFPRTRQLGFGRDDAKRRPVRTRHETAPQYLSLRRTPVDRVPPRHAIDDGRTSRTRARRLEHVFRAAL